MPRCDINRVVSLFHRAAYRMRGETAGKISAKFSLAPLAKDKHLHFSMMVAENKASPKHQDA